MLGILALALGAVGWAALARQPEPVAAPAAPAPVARAPAPAARATKPIAGATVLKSHDVQPTHLRIPAIDVSANVTTLGIHPDQTVEVPARPDEAGWYRLGSRPGQHGSAVLLGHVDSMKGPAVFYRLHSLTRGDEIDVRGEDGSALRFEVTSIATYPNADFPTQQVYRTTGRPGLALVTCGGRYDAAHGGYQSNVVVFAALADTP